MAYVSPNCCTWAGSLLKAYWYAPGNCVTPAQVLPPMPFDSATRSITRPIHCVYVCDVVCLRIGSAIGRVANAAGVVTRYKRATAVPIPAGDTRQTCSDRANPRQPYLANALLPGSRPTAFPSPAGHTGPCSFHVPRLTLNTPLWVLPPATILSTYLANRVLRPGNLVPASE
jgi:hypothetical protein